MYKKILLVLALGSIFSMGSAAAADMIHHYTPWLDNLGSAFLIHARASALGSLVFVFLVCARES